MKKLEKFLPLIDIIAAFLGILSIVFCTLAGVIVEGSLFGVSFKGSYTEFQLMFGKGSELNVSAGLVIAFVLLILGILVMGFIAFEQFTKKKLDKNISLLLGCVGFLLFLVAGIMLFCTFPMCNITADENTKVGAGVIIPGLAAIFAAILSLPNAVMPFVK